MSNKIYINKNKYYIICKKAFKITIIISFFYKGIFKDILQVLLFFIN